MPDLEGKFVSMTVNCDRCGKKIKYKRFKNTIVPVSTRTMLVIAKQDDKETFITEKGRYFRGHKSGTKEGTRAYLVHKC